jgi:hypothetical protein
MAQADNFVDVQQGEASILAGRSGYSRPGEDGA